MITLLSVALFGQPANTPTAEPLTLETFQEFLRDRDPRLGELRPSTVDGVAVRAGVLVSQTWREIEWEHRVALANPADPLVTDHALLIIGAGSAGDGRIGREATTAARYAKACRMPVVVVGQVPYQPIFGLTEDNLVALSFVRFLQSKDPTWPLLLPMVKSVAAAMDAAQADAAARGAPLEGLVLMGGA